MNERWPWLSPGWEVVEEVEAEEISRRLLGMSEYPTFFDVGYIYVPADKAIRAVKFKTPTTPSNVGFLTKYGKKLLAQGKEHYGQGT